MNRDTDAEVVKAFAYGMDIEDIANFAETTVEEIKAFQKQHAAEIQERKNAMEEFNL